MAVAYVVHRSVTTYLYVLLYSLRSTTHEATGGGGKGRRATAAAAVSFVQSFVCVCPPACEGHE